MPYADVRVDQIDGHAWAEGGHVRSRTPLADLIETAADGTFVLLGRQADMVNIAGKRSSLAYLTQVLLRVPGVVDGAFFCPRTPSAPRSRAWRQRSSRPGSGRKR